MTKKLIERYGYKNTTSRAGSGEYYQIDPAEIDVVKKWHNYYGNPSYVYHMSNGDTYYLVDDFGGMNDITANMIYCKRKKDLFIKWAR